MQILILLTPKKANFSLNVQILTIFPQKSANLDAPESEKLFHKFFAQLGENNFFGRLGKGSKKNLEFSRFALTHPPTLVITKNLGKKIKFLLF